MEDSFIITTPTPSPGPEIISLRSRASSIVSTSTKTSITTLPQNQFVNDNSLSQTANGIDLHLGRRNFRITARPGSILSISSIDQPAPPYTTPSTATETNKTTTTTTTTPASTDFPPTLPSQSPEPIPCEVPSSPSTPPLPTFISLDDPANALSTHYSRIVKQIDNNHRSELAQLTASHTSALAATRHAIDAAYRIEFRALRKETEKVREECAGEIATLQKAHVADIEALQRAHEREIAELEKRQRELGEAHAAEIGIREIDKGVRASEWLIQKRKMEEVLEGERREKEEREEWWVVECERRVMRATNEVEEIWEGRWRERMGWERREAERVREVGGGEGQK